MSLKNAFRAVIIGAPASGKGTISGRIVKKFNLKHISSGDILRQNIEDKTKLGNEAKKYIESGQLVPDSFMIECILDKLKNLNSNNWLLDGFPRTTIQAQKLWDVQPVDAVIHLIVPFDVIIERVQGRWIHLPSGRVYNIGFNEPKVAGKDDETGELLTQRPDDKPEAVLKRLEIYDSITKPVLEFYEAKNIVKSFTGKTTDEIWPKVKEFLDKKIN